MKDDFTYSLLKSGIKVAHDLSSEEMFFSWKEMALYLFQHFRGLINNMSIYTLDQNSENMEEEVVIGNDGAISGLDHVPIYQLPDDLLVKLQPVQIEIINYCRTLIPLHHNEFLIGFIELRTNRPIEKNTLEAFCDMASALSLGVYLKAYRDKAGKDKYLFDAVMHINHAIQSCSSIDELILTFSKLTIEFLKFDRLTVFICNHEKTQILHNFCVNAKGEIHTLENVTDAPFDLSETKPLEDMSGFWIPVRLKDKTLGVVLADNIYTLSEIQKDSITVLSVLCAQLALSIEHLHLLNNINRHAQFDDLTGVLNRRMSIEALEHYIAISKRNMNPFTLCYIDMNYMKFVNDKFGHIAGDDMLKKFTQIIKEHVRQNDVIGRVGGDEFIIIFPGCDMICAEKIWNRIEEGFTQFNNIHPLPCEISASHGMAQFNPEDDLSPGQLISIADKMMYEEKAHKHLQ